ncbi:hypothetical protein [Gynuella sunshinyii]|uniref:ABC-type Fe3+ transport system, permease component n=1 Tax=Gynuella sunshinyii YC6258 TaxID=1445510 RepID=A0A0C5VK02_9GAMM|nr:hypothetical protein [Gynuella sunshinyii]AJQ93698.1 ABC-type Fe3+ transport system, permease component [Gynuella sunshinyii YC6258]
MALNSRTIAAALALCILCSATLLSFSGLTLFRTGEFSLAVLTDDYILRITRFSLWQAFLSALISTVAAIPIARALFYFRASGSSRWLLHLSLLAFVMPTLILITGLVILLGPKGLITPLLEHWLPHWNLYGLNGILIAHVYLNLPFAVRSLYLRLQQIPEASWRLTEQFRLPWWQIWRQVEWPILRPTLLLVGGFIFMLCFNSFAIVLALGGGPRATTLEVAIYQALKYDFNMNEALLLAWLQLILSGSVLLLVNLSGRISWLNHPSIHQTVQPPKRLRQWIWMPLVHTVFWLFLLSPIVAIVLRLLSQDLNNLNSTAIIRATGWSLLFALVSATLATILGWALLLPVRFFRNRHNRTRQHLLEWIATHTLPLPAMVISVGIFIVVISRGWLEHSQPLWIIWINAVIACPFVISQLKPSLFTFDLLYQRQLQNWRPSAWQQTWVEFKYLRTILIQTFALAWVLCLGDVAVFSIFGDNEIATLPWLIYQFAGSYQMYNAAFASTCLLLICAISIILMERYHGENGK